MSIEYYIDASGLFMGAHGGFGALGLWGFGKAQGRASGLGRRRAGGEERREEGLQGPSPRSNGSKAASIERDLAEL